MNNEWEKEFVELVTQEKYEDVAVPPQWIDFIQNLLTSRGTHWKERVQTKADWLRSEIEKLEKDLEINGSDVRIDAICKRLKDSLKSIEN